MPSILILTTCYDANTSYTSRWAAALQHDLVQQKNKTCLLFDAACLCRSGTALADAIERVDFVVFYGHGQADEWTALPELGGASPTIGSSTLVDVSTVDVLSGRKVYACCCSSLSGLGVAYVRKFPHGEYVGYNQEFGFEAANEDYFRQTVHQSVISFVDGDPAKQIVADLRKEWAGLRDRFVSGNLKGRPQAAMAAHMAELNSQRIGMKP